ncbi:amino acid permease [Sphingomonas immobilis]|uniref:Arginine/agmatine antiporter n=1 Tax=Sphingomonas immobilis TaxID=3063997 RepID=A0ABT9A2G6_9SPHN|nr:amino acid permease [Sphingomonas sp. CA1-15]MDO7842917.1 amino acid permease [Sphingomonas sp. CA1-15]
MDETTSGPGRVIGFWACLALVVGNLIGSGIYLLPANLAPLGWNGAIGWVVTIGGALCIAHVFARLCAHLPAAGGPYAYTRAAFGHLAAFFVAWAYWIFVWLGNAAIAVAVVSALSVFAPAVAAVPGLPAVLAVALVWAVTLVNIAGIGAASRVQMATTLLKLLPLFAVIGISAVVLLTHGADIAANVAPVPLAAGAISGAVALSFWGFVGLESATVPAAKIRDPRRTIPRATMIGVVLTGVVYILVSTAITVLMPHAQAAASPAPIAAFIATYWGAAAGNLVALFAAISAAGALNGYVMVQGEVAQAMAVGGVFPRWMAPTNAAGSPARAHIVSSILLTIVTLMNFSRSLSNLFEFMALVSIATGLMAYLACAAAALKLIPHERALWFTAPLAAAFALWAIYGCGLVTLAWGLVLIALGVPVYLWVLLVEKPRLAKQPA